jgi:uncharacterized repeat protein (TIGR03847 family)
MAGQVFDYDPPERFVAGTVGEPGGRTFFLQARGPVQSGGPAVLTTVTLEKQQVAALADRVEQLLDEVLRRSAGQAKVPAVAPVDTEDLGPLDTPIEEEFRVGTMSLAWDGDRDRIIIECFELVPEDVEEVDDESDDPETDDEDDVPAGTGGDRQVLRVSITGAVARAFAKRALAVVDAGRPPCPFCTEPLDPAGHVCPRANGYRR